MSHSYNQDLLLLLLDHDVVNSDDHSFHLGSVTMDLGVHDPVKTNPHLVITACKEYIK